MSAAELSDAIEDLLFDIFITLLPICLAVVFPAIRALSFFEILTTENKAAREDSQGESWRRGIRQRSRS